MQHDPHRPAINSGILNWLRTAGWAFWRGVAWLGGHEFAVLVGLLVICGGIWVFIELAQAATGDTPPAFDVWLLKSLRRPDDPALSIGPAWLAESMRDITALGGVTVLSLVTAAVVGFLLLARKFSAMAFVLVATGAGFLITVLLKALYERPRPEVVPHLAEVYTSSFPSGHSMMSAVVYLTLGTLLTRLVSTPQLKFYFLSVALILTGLVGISRVYLGVHYPTDVLAGWCGGLAWASLCSLVARRLQQRGAIEPRL
jgi:undecaprenyl-diphosphatase